MLGSAISGPLSGARLEQLPSYNSMWFAWSTYWPETSVWDPGDGIIDTPPPSTAVLEPAVASIPDGIELTQNYPNRFNPETHVRFTLPVDGHMTLHIYNTTGQRVRSLADGVHSAGFYDVNWDGTNYAGRKVASGTYPLSTRNARRRLSPDPEHDPGPVATAPRITPWGARLSGRAPFSYFDRSHQPPENQPVDPRRRLHRQDHHCDKIFPGCCPPAGTRASHVVACRVVVVDPCRGTGTGRHRRAAQGTPGII